LTQQGFERDMHPFQDFSAIHWLSLSAIILGAGLIHGTFGIGFPMVATPLIALFLDVRSVMLMLLLPTMCINLANIFKGGNWKESIGRYGWLAAYGAVGSGLGTRLLVVTDPDPYRLLLSGAILLYLNMHRFGMRMEWVRQRPRLAYAVFGLTGGFLAGTVNVMLPPLVIFALEMGLAPTAMIQTFNFCFFFGKLTQGATFAASGLLTGAILLSTLPVALLALAALLAGMRARDRIDTDSYRGWLRRLLYGIAVLLAGQFFLS
jgi:hypothetical protein